MRHPRCAPFYLRLCRHMGWPQFNDLTSQHFVALSAFLWLLRDGLYDLVRAQAIYMDYPRPHETLWMRVPLHRMGLSHEPYLASQAGVSLYTCYSRYTWLVVVLHTCIHMHQPSPIYWLLFCTPDIMGCRSSYVCWLYHPIIVWLYLHLPLLWY